MSKADVVKIDKMWSEIDGTGFANGDQFENEEEVREYFTVENVSGYDQNTLEQFAEVVIKNRRHCKF